jgi:ribosomal protein S18 acetylase RimI-like enzyme
MGVYSSPMVYHTTFYEEVMLKTYDVLPGDEIILVDIAFLAEYRDRGIGTTLVTELQREATNTSIPLRLSVLRNSPAQRLYERLGFRAADQDEMYIKMEWRKK